MTELKTLEDFYKDGEGTWIDGESLKQEAVKWVKEQEKYNKNKMGEKEIYLRTWIKTFFNLAPEDLK